MSSWVRPWTDGAHVIAPSQPSDGKFIPPTPTIRPHGRRPLDELARLQELIDTYTGKAELMELISASDSRNILVIGWKWLSGRYHVTLRTPRLGSTGSNATRTCGIGLVLRLCHVTIADSPSTAGTAGQPAPPPLRITPHHE